MNIFGKCLLSGSIFAALFASCVESHATVYYLGGEQPSSGDWLSSSWPNLTTQLGKLTSGDELWIATGTVTRVGGSSLAVSVPNVSIKGAWQTTGGTWTRAALTNKNNRSILDGASIGYLMQITAGATNVLLEGLWLKQGYSNGDVLGTPQGNLTIYGTGAILDYCNITDGKYNTYTICAYVGLAIEAPDVIVRRCLFRDNNANVNQYYGAVHLRVAASNCRFTECEFYHNVSDTDQAVATYNGSGSTIIFDNCLFYDPRPLAPHGAGTVRFVNCTFHTVQMRFWDGNGYTKFYNCVISESGDFVFNSNSAQDAYVEMYNSLVDNLSRQTGTSRFHITSVTNLDIDAGYLPAFKNAASSNFNLATNSAAIEKGITNWLGYTYQGAVLFTPPIDQTDLNVLKRIQGKKVDMGAFEALYKAPGMVITLR
ncbi:MAG: hypothetical protein C0404_11820 [Verrucomicrobia bacterium]|nr:hypothetical protein [Verrucomicrobiota bacterium]